MNTKLLTVRKLTDDEYEVRIKDGAHSPWTNDVAGREFLHTLLASTGWKRVLPDESDELAGTYRKYEK